MCRSARSPLSLHSERSERAESAERRDDRDDRRLRRGFSSTEPEDDEGGGSDQCDVGRVLRGIWAELLGADEDGIVTGVGAEKQQPLCSAIDGSADGNSLGVVTENRCRANVFGSWRLAQLIWTGGRRG